MTVIDFNKKLLETNNAATSPIELNEALKNLGLEDFVMKVARIFSDQVSCVCTETGEPLFDLARARIIREKLRLTFDAVLEVIDGEIEDYG